MGEIVKSKGKRQVEKTLTVDVSETLPTTIPAKVVITGGIKDTLAKMEKELDSFDNIAVMFHITMIKLKFKELIEKAKTQI